MALTTSLVSYWKMDEASGARADSHGSNTLTDNNTVASATGKINSSADFEKDNSESLSIASNSTLQTGDIDFTIAAWVNLESLPTAGDYREIVAKDSNVSGGREYNLESNGDQGGRFVFGVSRATDALQPVIATTFGIPSTGVWYLVIAWHDAAADQVGIAINAGAADTAATGGGLQGASSADFCIGARVYSGFPSYFDGLIDEVGIWKRVLTSQERTDLYNSGNGLAYPFTVPTGIVRQMMQYGA